ncbi:MAG: NAD(P)-dependent alcohol dehydrogenase, partial [Bdellovibrionales bacterium]|nr:NAD(P)-dependent alcohol dehydrogenase [Bdellovibrionales bacterium]
VGSYAVQIGKALGADVTAVCSEANAAMVKRLGVARTIDYKSQDFLSEQTQYDTIFDTIGKHNWKTCSKVLSRQGCFVSTVPNPANLTSMALSRLRNLVGHSQRSEVVMVSSKGTDLEKLTGLIETGQITPLIDSVFPLKDAKQAHDHSRSLRAKGKIILEVQPQGVRDEQPI